MKKLLLLFALTLVSIGSQAKPFDEVWTQGDYSITPTPPKPENNHTQTLAIGAPGSLAAWVAEVANADGTPKDGHEPYMGLGEQNDAQTLKIVGELNAADFAALSTTKCKGFSKFANIDLSGVTVAAGVTDADVMAMNFNAATWDKTKPDGTLEKTITGNGAEFIRLPNGVTDVTEMATLTAGGKNPNLKVAGCYDITEQGAVDKTHFAAYSFQKENLNDFCEKFFPNDPNNASSGCELTGDNHTNDLVKLTLGGQIAVTDISSNNGQKSLFPSTSLNEMDLLHSTFESCEITVPGAFGQNDSGGDYTRKSTVTTPCGDVVVHDTVTHWPGETITSNALYYLSNYSLVTCVLPEGNTEIPPHTFASSSGTGPIRNITIPEGYTHIGFEAFYGHDLLTLELPSTMQVVEAGAFRDIKNVSQLTDVTMKPLQGTCTFGEGAFMRNFMLKHVTLSEGVTNISDYMFNQCYLLESVRIPSTCQVIGEYSFYETFDLHSVTIPEGVQYILEEAFELGGLTDLYIMATSLATLPKIFSMDPTYNQTNQSGSSFTYQRTSGNNTVPKKHLEDEDYVQNGHWDEGYDDVVTWYQEELSGVQGVGTGNALVALHYPDEMKGFYEGIDVSDFYPDGDLNQYVPGWRDSGRDGSTGGWLDMANSNYQGKNFQDISKWMVNGKYGESNYNGTNNATGDAVLQYLPQAYSVNPHQWETEDHRMGPDKNNAYYPNQTDYVMRLAAGATDNGVGRCLSAWGWRQFPLAYSIGDMGKVPFDKLYDDTWYTMCFPWHMTDEELFSAFNQEMEITEFVGVEMIEQGDHETNVQNNEFTYEMVMHFDDVAVTTYRDNNDVEYDREKIGTRQINGEVRNVYRYTSKDGNNTVVEFPLEYTDVNGTTQNSGVTITEGSSLELRERYGKYLTIQNILSLAGHPYMIHPSIGANPGNPATVYINATPRTGEEWTPENQAVTKIATVDDPNWEGKQEGDEYTQDIQNTSGVVPFVNPITNAGGSYTFIGNVGDVSKLLDEDETGTGSGEGSSSSEYDEDGNKVMPTPAYFLAVKPTGNKIEVQIPHTEVVTEVVPGEYIYTYVGMGDPEANALHHPEQYTYVGDQSPLPPGADYVPTAWSIVTSGTGSYNFNTAALTYTPNSGSYNPVTFVVNTNNQGTYNYEPESRTYIGSNTVTTDAYHVKQKVTKWQYTTDNTGEYSGTPEHYVYNNNGTHDVVAGSETEVAGGAYDAEYSYVYNANHNGDWEPSGYSNVYDSSVQDEYKNFIFKYNDQTGEYNYVGINNGGTHKATGWEQKSDHTGRFDAVAHYLYVGDGNGHFNVEFEWKDYSNQPYQKIDGNLQYQSTTGYSYKAVEWEDDPNGQWLHTIENYSYAGSNGTHDPATFEEVTQGQGNYSLAQGADPYIYCGNGGDYEPTAWTNAGEGQGTYTYTAAYYEDVEPGQGDYKKSPKTVQRTVTTYTTELRDEYERFPKYYRKTQTSGNKWSKYSAIIQPNDAAITNIENYLNMAAASANGYNVSFGEWEEVTTTAIKKIVEEAEQNNLPVQKIHLNVVYNIKGQVVRNDGSTSLEGLPKGLYIVNGKKYMVK